MSNETNTSDNDFLALIAAGIFGVGLFGAGLLTWLTEWTTQVLLDLKILTTENIIFPLPGNDSVGIDVPRLLIGAGILLLGGFLAWTSIRRRVNNRQVDH